MNKNKLYITVDTATYPVLTLPGRPKALLDRTLARLYQVETKRINEAVTRNPKKFPSDFYFELNAEETSFLDEVAFCDFVWKGGHKPKAFTPYGVNMLCTILKSEIATRRCVQIIKSFTDLELSQNYCRDDNWDIITAKIIASINNRLDDLRLEFNKRMLSIEKRVQLLEKDKICGTISQEEATILKKFASERARNKSEITQLWQGFKKYFGINKYADLPKSKMDDALRWISHWKSR